MEKEQFEILMYALYGNNQLFIPQGQTISEWIDSAFNNAQKQGENLPIKRVIPMLRCKWNGKKEDGYKITIGKTYRMIKEHQYYYNIIDDLGEEHSYNKSCFELISN